MTAPAVHPRFPRRTEFRAWLAAQDPAAIVGKSGTANHCPLARYVQAHGFPEGQVDADLFSPSEYEESRPLPAWAHVFMYDVDRTFPRGLGGPITARGALALLDSIPVPRGSY